MISRKETACASAFFVLTLLGGTMIITKALAAGNITDALLQGYRDLDNNKEIQTLTMQRPETPLQLYPLLQKGAGDLRACFLPIMS